MRSASGDRELIEKFHTDVLSAVPHLDGGVVVNPTPLVDVTEILLQCAAEEYGLHPAGDSVKVFAKLDSQIKGGSVKVRPALSIVEQSLASGKLRKGQTIFEATSGNFGLALGMLGRLELDVVAVVSRRIQQGVVDQLKKDGGQASQPRCRHLPGARLQGIGRQAHRKRGGRRGKAAVRGTRVRPWAV